VRGDRANREIKKRESRREGEKREKLKRDLLNNFQAGYTPLPTDSMWPSPNYFALQTSETIPQHLPAHR